MDLTIFALGHSNQPFERFLEELKVHGVRQVVDVRTIPRSRAVPWAGRERLELELAQKDIRYLHLPGLGGLRHAKSDSANTGWRNASFRGYADYMQTSQFEQALLELMALARQAPTAIMCAEALPWRCHRSLIADALMARGVRVVQILSPTQSRPHEMTKFAKVKDGRVWYPGDGKQAKLS